MASRTDDPEYRKVTGAGPSLLDAWGAVRKAGKTATDWLDSTTLTGGTPKKPPKPKFEKGTTFGPEETIYPGGYKMRKIIRPKASTTDDGKTPRKTSPTPTKRPQRPTTSTQTLGLSPSPMRSHRAESAGYTTSSVSRNEPGFTYGSKSSTKKNVAAAKAKYPKADTLANWLKGSKGK